jgi:hypothetical protein
MASPLQFDIPHQLGKAEARRRIQAGIPKLERHIPGGGQVETTWLDEDRVALAITAMGQKVSADLLIEETSVKASVTVPLMLSMMAGPISGFVKTSAEKMLAAPAGSTGSEPKA